MPRPTRKEFVMRTEQLIAYIRGQVHDGTLQPGDYLPSELELGKTFGLSKESVRKALDLLVEDGLVVKVRRVGNRIARAETASPAAESISRAAPAIPPPIDGELVLRVAHYPNLLDEALLLEAASSFEQHHPGIRVQLMETPFPLHYMELGIADVATVTGWDALKAKEEDPALPLLADAPATTFAHPLLAQPFLSDDGARKAAPFVFSPLVLCYNRTHFEQCGLETPGPDWTWYTLLKTARTIHRKLGVRGFVSHIQSVNRWPVFLLQSGFRFNAEEGARTLEDPALWDSLRISRDLIYQQDAPPLWTESDADVDLWFKEGKTSMILTTFFGLNRLQNAGLAYGVAPLPALRSRDSLLLTTGLAVHRDCPHPDAADAFLRFLCGSERQMDLRRRTLTLPAHPDALAIRTGLEGNRPYGESGFAMQWDSYRLYSDLNLSTKVLEALRMELKAYWSRLEDEAEASERLEAHLPK